MDCFFYIISRYLLCLFIMGAFGAFGWAGSDLYSFVMDEDWRRDCFFIGEAYF